MCILTKVSRLKVHLTMTNGEIVYVLNEIFATCVFEIGDEDLPHFP